MGLLRDGDGFLRSTDRKLWRIVYSVLVEWKTLIAFTHQHVIVPMGIPGRIIFFVPKDCQFRYEIAKFIEGHLKDMREDPIPTPENQNPRDWPRLPGTLAVINYIDLETMLPTPPAEATDQLIQNCLRQFKLLAHADDKSRERLLSKIRKAFDKDPEKLFTAITETSSVYLEEIIKNLESVEEEK